MLCYTAPMIAQGNSPREALAHGLTAETDECVEWPFAKGIGYGAMTIDREVHRVHVIACVVEHGPRPTNAHQAAHRCGVRHCFNRRHLRWVTQSDNEQDKVLHGLSNQGERNGQAKLTEADVRSIRCEVASGRTQTEVARQFKLSQSHVCNIINRKVWNHVD